MIGNQSENLKKYHVQALESFCEVCFVPFEKLPARKLDEGLECLYCIKCKCRAHKCCYDMEANSTFISSKIREFVCQKCSKKQTVNKSCMICHKKDGVMKVIEQNKVIHVFCGLMHRDISVTSYYPEISFKISSSYKEVPDKCNICHKNNATEHCAMQLCHKRYHGYCVFLNLKTKQAQQEDPHCQKYYLSSGDNGCFDLTKEKLPKTWIFEEFDKILKSFQEHGFEVENKERIKENVFNEYEKNQGNEDDQKNLRRGGFAYVLCEEHQTSIYCNCINKGDGDLVQCQCCFEWYHYKCVNYTPKKETDHYTCQYCSSFYDLKKKIIDEVKNSKSQHYDLKFDSPKLHLSDYLWLLRAIDCRISGGAATKMMKQLIQYPLKTSKMDLIIRSQNRKKIANLTEQFLEAYLQSEEHEALLRPKDVLGLDKDQKPITLQQNIEFNKKLREYIQFIQSFVRKNNLRDTFSPVMQELKFKEKAVEEDYETISELVKERHEYPEMKVLKVKMDAYSFMEILKDINSGSFISFEDLEKAVEKAKLSTSVPSYLLKPLIQRYEKVKNLVQLVSKNIHQYKETSQDIENAVRKLGEDKIYPPKIYQSFHAQCRLIKNLYLLYLKQEGKILEEGLDNLDKIRILEASSVCQPNSELVSLLNQYSKELDEPIYPNLKNILIKYMKVVTVYEMREYLKKKNITLAALNELVSKLEKYQVSEDDMEIAGIVNDWNKIKKLWSAFNKEYEERVADVDDIIQIGSLSQQCSEIISSIQQLPFIITYENDQIDLLGSLKQLKIRKQNLLVLKILVTQSQLKKNPMTTTKIPESLPKQNPLIKAHNSLKKQQNTLLQKYNQYYDRIKQKINILKSDSKKQRKDQIKENLEKPKLTDIYDFIEVLKNSKVSMENQIKALTKTVNNSLDIASKIRKFMTEQNHVQDIFNEQQLTKVKKEIEDLRKKVLVEAEICLDSELKELYQAELCLRMQMMIVSNHVELDKMNKLLRFAEEEELQHMGIYRRLKSKFEVGNESSKQANLFKKNESLLKSEGEKELSHKDSSFLYKNLANLRKSLNLGMPKQMKQKSSHVDALINRNSYLKNKIQMILMQQPKKYDIEEIKPVYFEALKHPFEVEGLGKLMAEAEKLEKIYRQWKSVRNFETSYCSLFIEYEGLSIGIEEIDNNLKSIKECQSTIKEIRNLSETNCTIESLQKIEELTDSIEGSHIEKTSEIYFISKVEYFNFWICLIKKFEREQDQLVPYCKVKSLLCEVYHIFQKCLKNNIRNDSFRAIINYFEGILGKIKKRYADNIDEDTFDGYIDVEDLRFQLKNGASLNEQIVILNPFSDLGRFLNLDLTRTLNKQKQQVIKRQRSQNAIQSQQMFKPTKMSAKAKEELDVDDDQEWDKNISNKVTDSQRSKIKQILLKNIRKNTVLASNIQSLQEQVKLIENQLFGEFHNDIVKYLEISNSFEKLFIKLMNFPNISARVAKKKLEWSFLKLLMESKDKFSDVEKALSSQPPKQEQKKQNQIQKPKEVEKPKEETQEKKKDKNIEEMIASGKLDQSVRREFKKQIKAIRDRNKKKKHKSSRKRSRSRSRSPQARFSSESSEQQAQNRIKPPQQQKSFFVDTYNISQNQEHFMFDPQESENSKQQQKISHPKGTLLQIKRIDVEFSLHKNNRGKVYLKNLKMMSNEDYKKIANQVVDPGFNILQIRKDKADHEIIAYLSKPSRKKYKFLFGWIEGNSDEDNQALRDFSSEVYERKRVFGVQNQHIKMHIMSIRQYLRITRLHDPNEAVTSESAANYLKEDRLVFLLQYPNDKMYELKGQYENFKKIQAYTETFPVIIPEVLLDVPERYVQPPMPYMSQFSQQPYIPQVPEVKQVELQGWGNTSESSYSNYIPAFTPGSTTYSNVLSRFSPIMSEEEDNNNENEPKNKSPEKEGEMDLASNILNSLADIDFKNTEIATKINRPYDQTAMAQERQFEQYRYQPPMGSMQVNPMHSSGNPMQGNRYPQYMTQPPQYGNRPYINPMSMGNNPMMNRYQGQQNYRSGGHMNNPMAYKNPMMSGNNFPPPPPQSQNPNYPQQGQYDPYQYQKRQ